MALRVRDLILGNVSQLRYEPVSSRVRATIDGVTLLDSRRAVLVWEPRWFIPCYAVPVEDLHAELVAEPSTAAPAVTEVTLPVEGFAGGGVPIVRPGDFRAHTAPGSEFSLRFPGGERPHAAYRLDDPDLAGHVLLDVAAFDAWLEEEEKMIHPRDPLHRVDVRRSARTIRVERDGKVLAESRAPRMLFEPPFPVRYYLPSEDVDLTLLQPSETRSSCPYKGHATYWAYQGPDDTTPQDVAWSYPEPLAEATDVAGMIAFYDDRVNVILDGEQRE